MAVRAISPLNIRLRFRAPTTARGDDDSPSHCRTAIIPERRQCRRFENSFSAGCTAFDAMRGKRSVDGRADFHGLPLSQARAACRLLRWQCQSERSGGHLLSRHCQAMYRRPSLFSSRFKPVWTAWSDMKSSLIAIDTDFGRRALERSNARRPTIRNDGPPSQLVVQATANAAIRAAGGGRLPFDRRGSFSYEPMRS